MRPTSGMAFRLINGRGDFLLPFVPYALIFIPDIPPLFIILKLHPSIAKSPNNMASQHPIVAASAKYPKPAERTFQYGTAGVGSPKQPRDRQGLANMALI